MSLYSRQYCPTCGQTTAHEDDCCMECGRGPLEGVVKRLKNKGKKNVRTNKLRNTGANS